MAPGGSLRRDVHAGERSAGVSYCLSERFIVFWRSTSPSMTRSRHSPLHFPVVSLNGIFFMVLPPSLFRLSGKSVRLNVGRQFRGVGSPAHKALNAYISQPESGHSWSSANPVRPTVLKMPPAFLQVLRWSEPSLPARENI